MDSGFARQTVRLNSTWLLHLQSKSTPWLASFHRFDRLNCYVFRYLDPAVHLQLWPATTKKNYQPVCLSLWLSSSRRWIQSEEKEILILLANPLQSQPAPSSAPDMLLLFRFRFIVSCWCRCDFFFLCRNRPGPQKRPRQPVTWLLATWGFASLEPGQSRVRRLELSIVVVSPWGPI